ncbi:hypothetical protein [Basilea psittacipulmonis]|uniref:hypothetical protein n=1 Tax=Basilea psittacipulmonis TaxID=1472345 RepID=UPI001300FAFD|nr:hypothetical protein [Basilea psittacipulmonis]
MSIAFSLQIGGVGDLGRPNLSCYDSIENYFIQAVFYGNTTKIKSLVYKQQTPGAQKCDPGHKK